MGMNINCILYKTFKYIRFILNILIYTILNINSINIGLSKNLGSQIRLGKNLLLHLKDLFVIGSFQK